MKKLIALVSALLLVFMLGACVSQEDFDEMSSQQKIDYCNISKNYFKKRCETLRYDLQNDKFSDYYNWNVCEDEFYVKTLELEIDNTDFARIDYRIVNEYQAYIKFYEDDYKTGGDIFNVEINAKYEIVCVYDD